jgi:soluble lytic murein transglycosylase-like protein
MSAKTSTLPGLPARLQAYGQYFRDAGEELGLDPYLLAAVCDRESNGRVDVVGADGHGYGLMQIDDRYHGAWFGTHRWQDPKQNIYKGAEILRDAIREFSGDTDAEFLGCCRYNASLARISAALKKANADKISRRMAADSVTTGGNYGSDTLRRRGAFKAKAEAMKS